MLYFQGLLTEKQICKLMDYKRQLQDEKQQELNARFQKAWQERDEVWVNFELYEIVDILTQVSYIANGKI